MKNKALLASAAAIIMLSAFLFSPVRDVVASVVYQGMSIINSDIEGTTVGITTPSTAKFTSAGVGNLAAGANGTGEVPWTPQGYTGGTYFGFNQNGSSTFESDFINYSSTANGGFYWWTPPSTGLTAAIMKLSPAGVLTVAEVDAAFHGNVTGNVTGNLTGNSSGTQSSYLNALIDGNDTLALTGSLGMNLGWNETAGGGESDFVNQQSTGTPGGFNWYNTVTHALGTAIMSLSGSGTLTVSQVNGNAATATTAAFANAANTANSATTAASTTGNSATATRLIGTPTQCANGATGIQPNGNANCISSSYQVLAINIFSGICTTGSGAYLTCNTTFFLSPDGTSTSAVTFASAPAVACSAGIGQGSNAVLGGVYVSNVSTTTFEVTLQNTGTSGGEGAVTTSEIHCVAAHN